MERVGGYPHRTGTPKMTQGDRWSGGVEAALDLVRARPAAVTPVAGVGARLAADRRIAAIVQRVVRQIVREDVVPDVALGPVGERRRLPQPVLGIPAEPRRLGPLG